MQRPHIIMMLADDWGSYDASFRMRELNRTVDIHTPHIDALALGGATFSNYYVQPICTPTRASLLSGRYSIHTGSEHILFGSNEPSCLPTTLPLMPQAFKALGYATHMVGKWHLGFFNNTCSPWRRGFDTYLGYLNGVEGYYHHGCGPYLDFHECVNNTDVAPTTTSTSMWRPTQLSPSPPPPPPPSTSTCDTCTLQYEGRYSTEVYTTHVEGLIASYGNARSKNSAPKQKPLFVYLAWQAVHEPMDAPASYVAPYASILDDSRRTYAGMLSCLDEGIGNITSALKRSGMYANTVIVMSNDNGGMSGSYGLGCCNCGTSCGGLNWPYRGWKDSFFEGGFRGIGFLHSPLLTTAAGFRYDPIIWVGDWYRTLVSAALSNDTPAQRTVARKKIQHLLSVGPIDSIDQWGALTVAAAAAGAGGGAAAPAGADPRTELLLAGVDIDKHGAAIRVGRHKLLVGDWGGGGRPNSTLVSWCDLNRSESNVPWYPAPPAKDHNNVSIGGEGGIYCAFIEPSTKRTFNRRKPSLSRTAVQGKPTPWSSVVFGLFDVVADPRELEDLQDAKPDIVAALMLRLVYWNGTTAPSVHKKGDPNGTAHANATDCWSPWGGAAAAPSKASRNAEHARFHNEHCTAEVAARRGE